MKMESLQDLFVDDLKNLRGGKKRVLPALPERMINRDSENPEEAA